MPKVSVVIPVYNRAGLIKDTIDSVLAQTYRDFEIIVVDDGSTDTLTPVITKYGSQLRYVWQENKGQGGARNNGIRCAKGEYIAFLDSDDLWLPEKLVKQMQFFEKRPELGLVYCDSIVFDNSTCRDLFRYNKKFPVSASLLISCYISSPTPVVRKNVFEKTGYFSEEQFLRQREDWDMWLRIAAKYPVAYVDEPLARLRLHNENITGSENPVFVNKCRIEVIDRAVTFAPDVYGPSAIKAKGRIYFETGKELLLRIRKRDAREYFLKAFFHKHNALKCIFFILVSFINQGCLSCAAKVYNRIKKAPLFN